MEEEGNIDVFNTTMNFLIPNGLTPSASLLKEYSESEVAKKLQLPTRDYLNSKFAEDWQISEVEYKLMKERYNSRSPFIYFFNPCFKTEERVWESKDWLLLGYFKNGTMVSIYIKKASFWVLMLKYIILITFCSNSGIFLMNF